MKKSQSLLSSALEEMNNQSLFAEPTITYHQIQPFPGGEIYFDLDGTLAFHHTMETNDDDYHPEEIGKPIGPLCEIAREYIKQGYTVKIFTARIDTIDDAERGHVINAIQDWTEKHLGARLDVTNQKTKKTAIIYDDRAYQVLRNLGQIVKHSPGAG